jgi:hypothetical protein
MIQVESERPRLEQDCRNAIAHLIARHDWQLLDRDEFVRRTLAELHTDVTADPQRAAIYTYSKALHLACSGAEGPERQRRAYTELFRYLYDSARRRYPDVCHDATRRALERVFTSFERCRQPGAFLAFALQHLMDAARLEQAGQRPRSLPASTDGAKDER